MMGSAESADLATNNTDCPREPPDQDVDLNFQLNAAAKEMTQKWGKADDREIVTKYDDGACGIRNVLGLDVREDPVGPKC